ncbi:hypothetical protein [Staphylospora marina]|uniref:hypothetical protein n=1 Tax=Staphylospora marina TaxID=2490858 RepID=UPI000F5BFDC3|nr:hypothetical protein [Staphylospora marina]
MRILRWTAIWMIVAMCVTGLIAYMISESFDPGMWKVQMRAAGGVFFLIALVVGGVLTTEKAFRNRRRWFYREDWSFICLLVTVGLFGISLLLS